MALSLSRLIPRGVSEGILAMLAGGTVGRLLAPLTPVFVALGAKDRSNRFILNIGDEGATLVQVRGGQVVDAVFAEASNDDGWQALREMLASDSKAHIIVVADVLEQMFREDTVPKVGWFDRGKIVKRRLDLTFPNEVLKAALPGPRKRGAPQAVTFMALPMSEHLNRWIAFLDEFPNPARGFYLLPLEVVGITAKLSPAAAGETRKHWRALITQEAASGFRQVFDLGGKMIVTRLTQRPSQPLTPEAEAMLIERELRSSISYVKRLGFSDADRLDVVVLADPAVCRAVDERDLPATTVTVYTPYQAGIMLELGEVGREDSPFADVLLGLWIAGKRRPLLALPTPKIFEQLRIGSIVRWSAAAAAALTVGVLYYGLSLITDLVGGAEDAARLRKDIATINRTLTTETNRMRDYPIDAAELLEVASTQDRLQMQEVDLVGLVRKVGGALGSDARATSISYEAGTPPPQAAPHPNAKGPATPAPVVVTYKLQVKVRIALNDAEQNDNDAPLRHAKTVLARLSDAFPGLAVQATQLPDTAMRNQVVEGTSDQKQVTTQAAATAEYTIRRDR